MRQVRVVVIAVVAACGGNNATTDAAVDTARDAPLPGKFAPQVAYPTGTFVSGGGTSPLCVKIGDLNDDGKPDLAVANNGNFNDAVLLNTGNGSFAQAVEYPAGNVVTVAVGDLNGDGKMDLVDSSFRRLNNGNGTFAAQVLHDYRDPVVLADLNNDGKLDLIGGGGGLMVSVSLGNGDGTFGASVPYATRSGAHGVAVGDFNGDGQPDLVATNFGNQSFNPPFTDVDNVASVFVNNGNGTFAAQMLYTTSTTPVGVAVGDFNGDGTQDLAVTSYTEQKVSVLMGNGDGTFRTPETYPADTRYSQYVGVAVGDLNGDGKLDLAVVEPLANKVRIFQNNGDGTFSTQVTYATGMEPQSVAIGDLNGDQRPDIVVSNRVSNNVGVFLWVP